MSTTEFEARLRAALRPVDPPHDFAARLEGALVSLHELAADELEAWELSAMRDPRNWARPAAAALVGARAGGRRPPGSSTSPAAPSAISRTRRAACSPDGIGVRPRTR